MEKIKTIFLRDEKTHKISNSYINKFEIESLLKHSVATEKLDGMNVRVTIRNHQAVRLEKRKNPTKEQKAQNIIEPWYVDANENDPQDKWLFDALKNTDLKNIPDGSWSGEAIGKNIQGNN